MSTCSDEVYNQVQGYTPLGTLPPNTASQHFDLLHSELLNSHLNVCPQSVSHESDQSFILSSPHLDVRRVCSLPLALGGHGLLPVNLAPSSCQHSNSPINHSQSDLALTYHDSAFFASWSATWSLIRAWVPPLREESFPSVTNLSPNSPLPPYKAQVIRTWLLINAASAKLQHHLHRAVLPSHDKIPSFFHPLEMVRMNPLPNRQFLPKPPPTTLLRATRTASSLLVSSTFNLPSKSKLLSPHLFLPLPSLMCFNPRLTRAKRDSSMAPLSMDHRRGMLECPSPSGSAISSREPTRSQLGLLICSLAPHISLIKNCLSCSTAIAATASGVICNITSRRSVPALCYQHAPVAFMAKTPVRGGLAN